MEVTELNIDFRLGIVALGILFDFEGLIAGSNGASSLGPGNQVRFTNMFYGER